MASLIALDESFKNHHYNNVKEKNLFVFGGIVQESRGPVGSQGSGSHRGFVKDYKYDQRYALAPPPYYPMIMYTYDVWNLNP